LAGFRQRDEETKENVGKSERRNDGKEANGLEREGREVKVSLPE